MLPNTHLGASRRLVGVPEFLDADHARCSLQTTSDMVVDDRGLVHGGFVFGLADYAAMLAVNHHNVVLGGAEVRFTAPVAHPASLVAVADVETHDGPKREVEVLVTAGGKTVLRGRLTCFILDRHVLDRQETE